MKVCLDARVRDLSLGGARQVLVGLASGFSQLEDGDDRYDFLSYPSQDWLLAQLRGPCAQLPVADRRSSPLVQSLKRSPAVRRVLERSLAYRSRPAWTMPSEPTQVSTSSPDVVHFLLSEAFRTELPSVYQLHDLQYLHLPELFPPAVRRRRETKDRAFCAQAHTVAVMSDWAREDLVSQLGVAREKVAVVPWASFLDAYAAPGPDAVERIRRSLRLPDRFVLYPAQSWPHKNHLRLLTSLALLRDRHGLHIPLVLTGARTRHHDAVRLRVEQLGLQPLVLDVGFVAPDTLAALYEAAAAVVFPSLFEGFGMPAVEALGSGTPLACSTVCNLPELVQGAALLFDPHDEDDIADALRRLWTDEGLVADLSRRGRIRAADFSWRRSAQVLRALYRRAAGQQPDVNDAELLMTACA